MKVVEELCRNVELIERVQAFHRFFRQGRRKFGESIEEYSTRRRDEYERLRSITSEMTTDRSGTFVTTYPTNISDDLQNYFFVDGIGLTEQ